MFKSRYVVLCVGVFVATGAACAEPGYNQDRIRPDSGCLMVDQGGNVINSSSYSFQQRLEMARCMRSASNTLKPPELPTTRPDDAGNVRLGRQVARQLSETGIGLFGGPRNPVASPGGAY
ncbi:hypothetical protein [Burkholderia sp. BCC1977]|uniref:hypothetical protein n=1 Tax=Burkholderia sp. BCC1977 TaxID=2817440 RepID=UPI002ABE0559|nr:hypothetical protein [Burkholderia sp. BCC1977]